MTRRNQRRQPIEAGRTMQHLAEAAHDEGKVIDPMVEKLSQCPEAFKVGEILGKAFDSLKYRPDEISDEERLLPPPGTVLPPFA